jgi:hypothetical protein
VVTNPTSLPVRIEKSREDKKARLIGKGVLRKEVGKDRGPRTTDGRAFRIRNSFITFKYEEKSCSGRIY